jgi:DNA-binding transcriptional ArsR family regulator/uncharacterized protein YndB with AHSA1/START domain
MSGENDLIWKALADPIRRAILDTLRDGPKTTGALCEPFAQTRFGVMKHLDALEAAGLISSTRRGRERWNYLNAFALRAATERWLTPFQRVWTGRLDQLERFIEKGNSMPDMENLLMDIRQEVTLPASPERVFASLTSEIGKWWTSPYRQAGVDSRLRLIPEIGEPMIETGANGHDVIWGRVEEVRAPDILYISGRFAVTGAVAGRIHFDLAPHGASGCKLTVAHQAMGRIPPEVRAGFTEGWRDLLDTRLRIHLEGVENA